MNILEAFLIAMVCFSIVIIALAALYALVRLFSLLMALFDRKRSKADDTAEIAAAEAFNEISEGELKLINVDEKTAAMIMAIVSDESGIPLSELRFKSIKLIDNKSNE